MAYSSSSSNANSKVHTCSTKCDQSYAQLKKLYDDQREKLDNASVEITAYTLALKKVEAQLAAHQKNQLCQLSANDKAGLGHDGEKESKVRETITSVSKVETISTAQHRTRMNDAMQKPYPIYKAYSSVKRNFNKKTVNYNRYFNKRVNTVKGTKVNTVRPNAEVNTVKASASWVWKPKHEELDHVSKSNSASKTLTRYVYVDALGRFKSVLAWDFKRH
uniref:Uncharacterized protein n=1 Tax=Tanacetum cinerariifolium TaxID=118510 RepID=A0A6L2JVT9_TANCI|nr:hypothetical protein [Tanacetum cinerariifolium]